MNAQKLILEAKGLKKAWGELVAVDNVDLAIHKGECLALLGPNGAGKTTTCEMLEGLTSPDSGSVQILGMDLFTRHKDIMESVGVQLQETNLYKRFTVQETFELFASFYTSDTLPPKDLLSQLNLTEKANVRLGELSGGQHQRVALGCALVNKPDLLFLDEPTTGLDPNARRDLWQFIEQEKERGTSILLTTHYMEEAQSLADRVAIMDNGRIIAEDSPKELIKKYCGMETISLKLSHPSQRIGDLSLALEQALDWVTASKVINDSELVLYCNNSDENIQQFMDVAGKLQIVIHQFAVHKSHLEDVFVELTGKEFARD